MTTRAESERKLEAAISEYVQERGDQDGLMVDWFLIVSDHIDNGAEGTATGLGIYGPSHQRMYNALGLVDYAKVKIEGMIVG